MSALQISKASRNWPIRDGVLPHPFKTARNATGRHTTTTQQRRSTPQLIGPHLHNNVQVHHNWSAYNNSTTSYNTTTERTTSYTENFDGCQTVCCRRAGPDNAVSLSRAEAGVLRLHNPGNHGYGILTTGKRQWRQHGPATLSPNQLLTTSQAAPPGGEGATTSSHDTDRDDPVISVRVKLHRLAERLHKLRAEMILKQLDCKTRQRQQADSALSKTWGMPPHTYPLIIPFINPAELSLSVIGRSPSPRKQTDFMAPTEGRSRLVREVADESLTPVVQLRPDETAAGVCTAARYGPARFPHSKTAETQRELEERQNAHKYALKPGTLKPKTKVYLVGVSQTVARKGSGKTFHPGL
ncbi:hypothetical protein Bbelb_256550 [Branchiostoma belcheri]|nr:hypothetical protein Bbelb_256550 [Branchiostoma belcheri]